MTASGSRSRKRTRSGQSGCRTCERSRETQGPPGHLEAFATHVAVNMQAAVADVVGMLTAAVQRMPPVELYPYATFAQIARVRDVLAG